MKYGITPRATTVLMRGWSAQPDQVTWVKAHKSTGRYNFTVHGVYDHGVPSIKWSFANATDATLFSLKFK